MKKTSEDKFINEDECFAKRGECKSSMTFLFIGVGAILAIIAGWTWILKSDINKIAADNAANTAAINSINGSLSEIGTDINNIQQDIKIILQKTSVRPTNSTTKIREVFYYPMAAPARSAKAVHKTYTASIYGSMITPNRDYMANLNPKEIPGLTEPLH